VIASPLPAIRELSARILADLAQALRVGHLTGTATALMVRYAVPAVGEAAAVELSSLLASGLGPQHAALLLDALTAEREPRAHAADLELVTSGPDIAGATRDTGVVLRELFAEAEHRVLVVGFAVHQGREIFAALADRMQQRADLAVRLCLDVRRAPGDTTRSDALLRRFAERFVRQEWPGSRLPDLFCDPRSLAAGESVRASLHAKCVVGDGMKAFIGSANLTEAAQLRNIEIGLVVTGSVIADSVERHMEALIAGGHLRPLLLER
jgi:phosphatidylserine/phosphatidylglycerophosphate/cardiolipin synthase-like enzyme